MEIYCLDPDPYYISLPSIHYSLRQRNLGERCDMVHLHSRQQFRRLLHKQINVLSNMLHPRRNPPFAGPLLPRLLDEIRHRHLILQLIQPALRDVHPHHRGWIQRNLTRCGLRRVGIWGVRRSGEKGNLKTRRNREVLLREIRLVVLRSHYASRQASRRTVDLDGDPHDHRCWRVGFGVQKPHDYILKKPR